MDKTASDGQNAFSKKRMRRLTSTKNLSDSTNAGECRSEKSDTKKE